MRLRSLLSRSTVAALAFFFGKHGLNEWRRGRQLVFYASRFLLGFLGFMLIGGGLFYARLAMGPIALDGFAPQIATALGERFGHGYEFGLNEIAVIRSGYAPALRTGTLSIKDSSGRTILTAPRAEVSIDPLALIVGRVAPRRLEIFDVELHLALRPDGSLVLPFSAGSGNGVALIPPLVPAFVPQEAPGLPGAAAAAPEAPPEQRTLPAKPRSFLVKRLGATIRLAIDTLTNPASPAAVIDRIGIMRGKIMIDDEMASQPIVFDGVNLSFDKAFGATRFNLSVEGPNGRWQAFGLASGKPGSERRLRLSVANLSLDEILLATGTRTIGADFDMPLSGKLDIRLSSDHMLSEAAGQFDFGSGYLRFDDPDDEPMMIDQISGGFHWDRAGRRIMIDRWQLAAGATHFAASGSVGLPSHEGDPWSIRLENAEPGVAGPERPGETPILIDHLMLAARLYLAEKNLVVDRVSFSGPQCGLALAGTIDWTNGPRVRLGVSISPTPIRSVLRLWPSFIAAPVRTYLLPRAREGTVEKGTVQIDFDAADLRAMRAQHAPADAKALVDFIVTNGSLDFLPGVPQLRGIDGIGHITGRTATFNISKAAIDSGNGHELTMSAGGFHVADTDAKPVRAVVEANVAGSVEGIGGLLSHEALKPFASLPLDPATLHGQTEGNLEIDMTLGSKSAPSDTELRIKATVTNFTAERLIGDEKLDAATLTVDVDPLGLRAAGQGRMFGVPVTINMEKPAGKPAEASIGLTLDDETRATQGLGAIPGVSGPVGAKIFAPIGTGEKPKAKVELDLGAAAVDIAGISKPAGRPGKIAFAMAVNETGTSLDPLVVEAGAIQARGKVELGTGFSVITASFPQVKLSQGDDMRVEATSAGETLNIMVRGNVIDARPFLRSLIFSPPGSGNGAEEIGEASNVAGPIKEIEFDVRSAILSGYNKQMITGAELRFAKHGSQIKQFSFAGTFGRQPISCNLIGGGASPQLNLVSEDAGSLLSFLDLYKQMERGHLSVGMIVGQQELTGVLIINDFVLRDEPALRRLVIEGAPPLDTAGRPQKIDANAVAFDKLQVRFRRDGTRLVLSEGTMNGQAIGLTVDGTLDFVHDSVDMRGTFVPIYAFNNMFARIPVIGLILGGGSEQGLIGVNYRISGRASAPTLSINPLSAVAPGIFRQIFGVVDFDPMHPQQ